MTTSATRTTCPYCGVGCGLLATPKPDGGADIKGDPHHPANFGRLCSKGSALGETLSLDDRLLYPEIRGERATWDGALDLVARGFCETIAAHGPDSVAFYVSGQILTEDYYVANKLMKGFIGSANIDTNSRLCMASSVAGHKRAFGSDTVPGCYEDLELADLVVLVGSNLAWCHPVLYQRLAEARESRGTKVVVVDPRRTATCDIASMHLAIAPGSDVALFAGLLTHLVGAGAVDRTYVQRHTTGFMEAFKAGQALTTSKISKITGIARAELNEFYDLFARTENAVTVYSQGVNQSAAGTDKVNAIINCHLATGRIGKPGMGPFSVTGQPNAMGGREVGGLANMLAAHMEIGELAHREIVQRFWASPTIATKPGLKAVDMFRAVGDGRIKAIWIMATNPVVSMPEANVVREALRNCPFVVVSDVVRQTDTTALAHVLLPSLAWGEKDGTVTNSERRISRQRGFLPPPGQARADWWQLAEVARRMGFGTAFAWSRPFEIMAEHAALTAAGNNGTRDLDIGRHASITHADYDALSPFLWPAPAAGSSTGARFFADGGFFTPDGRARFVATPYRSTAVAISKAYPLVLNTGRVRDQWHTMTRTAKVARLMAHTAESFIEMHPEDAAHADVEPGALAVAESPTGRTVLRAIVTRNQQRGTVFVPMHWTSELASEARIGALISGNVDPVSGQPELKAMPVAVSRYRAAWYGFGLLAKKPVNLGTGDSFDFWSLARATHGWRLELASEATPTDWLTIAHRLLGTGEAAEMLVYHDRATGHHRFAAFEGDRLIGALYVAREPVAVSRSWLADQIGRPLPDPGSRLALLAGRAGATERDKGAIVCACFEVGRNDIAGAIAGGCRDVTAVGLATKAGTNCGSCRAEIRGFIDAAPIRVAV